MTVEADNDILGSSLVGPSAQAQGFLKQVSASLYSLNAAALSDLMAGRLSGLGSMIARFGTNARSIHA